MQTLAVVTMMCLLQGATDSAPARPGASGVSRPSVPIAVDVHRAGLATIAAEELCAALRRMYPAERFAVVGPDQAAGAGRAIYVGTPDALQGVPGLDGAVKRLAGPESYVVTSAREAGRTVGLVVGADPRGVVNGVYGLLRKMGCGYLLDGDIEPAPRDGLMGFDAFDLADRPLTGRRFVFNWHNFLSGCSSWDLEHWRRWITQSRKMGYNAVMVHAYGNNPMAGFSLDGADKPVGYLSSSRLGRDWATMHVNDVRRLIGGGAFDSPVFGSAAAVAGTDAQRTAAARTLMHQVFEHAQRRGVDVIFAVDIDTDSANPQPLIARLPAGARYNVGAKGEFWLPRPDVPEGFAYYKAQVEQFLTAYPQIDTLVMWFRTQSTPLAGVKLEQLPEDWQKEYRAIVAAEPAVGGYWRSVGLFAMGKVAAAFEKALAELGRKDVSLGIGSWSFSLINAADRFMPKGTGVYPLDYGMLSGPPYIASSENAERLAGVAAHRPVYPILWAQHDDGKYLGPPYAPPENFHDLLARAKCDSAGFGIIHWTTRPLDVFFIGLSDAVWSSSRNQSSEATCRRLARAMLGEAGEEAMGLYLHEWLTGLPMIGRDTSPRFIDRELKGYDEALASHKRRMALLERLDRQRLSDAQRKRIAYFRGHERFIMSVFENESLYRRASELLQKGDLPRAREVLGRSDVPGAIKLYADSARLAGISRGEQGMIVSLNLRWYTHYLRLAQQAGAEPVRINFAPTSHDPLAQSPGKSTYLVDRDGRFWEVLGRDETKASAYGNPAGYVEKPEPGADAEWEVRQSGLESDQPITVSAAAMMGGGVPQGRSRLALLFGRPPGAAQSPRVFDAAVYVPGEKTPLTRRITLDGQPQDATFELDLPKGGVVQVKLTPVEGKAVISGLTLQPMK